MTDKVHKIREEVEKLKSNLLYGACASQVAMETHCKEEAYNEVLAILDSMQEEPVSKQKLSNVQRTVKNWKEPISEDLEEASKEWLKPQLDKSYADYGEVKMMELTHFDGYAMLDAIEFGAKWKEEQFEKNRLAACDKQTEEEAEIESDFVMSIIEKEHRQPTFDDAIKYGMRLQKKQMMKEALDGVLSSTITGSEQVVSAYVGYGELGKNGDKVKIIILKED